MYYPKIDPSSIDLGKALEMTLWSDHGWDKREPKRLTYKSNYFPKVIDFEELEKVKPPKGLGIEVYSRDLRIETTSYRGVCPGAVHYYCHIKFSGPSLKRGNYTVFEANGVSTGRIFGMHTAVGMIHGLLQRVASRAAELNDPHMNVLMLKLHLYDVPSVSKAIAEQEEIIDKESEVAK